MNWSVYLSLFSFILTISLYIGYKVLPNIYFKIRIRLVTRRLVKQGKNKKNTKSKWLDSIYKKLDIELKAASLPVTSRELLLVLAWTNFFILFTVLMWGFTIFFLLFISINGVLYLYIRLRKHQKKKLMLKQLPNALELISSALKTGYSIVQTLDLVAKENFPPLSEEFHKLFQALQLGENFEKSFTDFAKRLDIPELTNVVDTILITRETGGNVTEVIDGLLTIIRENEKLNGEVKTLTAQGKISGLIVGLLPLALFIMFYLINPSYMMVLFKNIIGIFILGTAVLLQIIGIIVMKKIITLKVR
ncbi:type II secretion system F family protein [Bacillus taeanensis]|nr:type II secretion system F family protein [Bacillus taeanensis]